ncbi:hypothetical protein ALC53_02564, partial [Atta colombica]
RNENGRGKEMAYVEHDVETERKERASLPASSSALRRHLNYVESGVERRKIEEERERERERKRRGGRRGRRRLAVIRWGGKVPDNSSQRPKTGSLCSTKATSGAQKEEDLSILQPKVTLSSNLFLGPNDVLSKIPSLIESVFQ